MANLVFKPATGADNKVIFQNQDGNVNAITVEDTGAIAIAGNSTVGGTLGVTGNVTMSGTANALGTVTSGVISASVTGGTGLDVSTATTTALNDKAPSASPTFTGTPVGITAAHILTGALPAAVTGGTGLDVSTATTTALNDKAPLASPAFTGTPTGITAAHITTGVLPVGVTGGSGLDAVPSSVSTGQIVSYKIVEFVSVGTTTCDSTTWAEVSSSLRITHAMSDSGNKLVFSFNSLDIHLASGRGYVAVGKTTDVTSRITADNLLYVKNEQGAEIYNQVGFAEYSPGVTTSITYTPIHSSTSLFYIINTDAQGKLRFSLMEVKG